MVFWFNAMVSGFAFVAMPYWIAEQCRKADESRAHAMTEELNVRHCSLCGSDQLHRRGVCMVCKTGADPYVVPKQERVGK